MTTKRAQHKTAIAAAAIAALMSAIAGPVAAMEEVTTSATVTLTAELKADFEAEMAAYTRTVEIELRDAVIQNLMRSGTQTLRLARATEAYRG